MKPTRIRDLFAIFAVIAVGVRLIAPRLYPASRFPPTAVVSLVLVAAFEAYAAATIRARLDGRPGTKPIMPLLVARYAALAKASSLAAVIAGGTWTGLFVFAATHQQSFRYAGRDALVSGVGVAAAALLTAVALYLERACRVRHPPEHRDDAP